MESVPLLPPPVSTRLVSSGPRVVKVFFQHERRRVHQRVDMFCHRLKKLDFHATQLLSTPPVSWHILAATLEGNVELDVCSLEGTPKNVFGETIQTSQNESKNVDQNSDALKHDQTFQTFQNESKIVNGNLDALNHGEKSQTSQIESKTVGQNLDASKDGQEQRRGKRYAPWTRKNITVEFDALKPGAILTGKVTNTVRFGAFVDVGAFTSGLIHISNLSNKFVNSVEDIVKVGQEVKVEVVSVSINPGRISLKLVREDETSEIEKPITLPECPEVQNRTPKLMDHKRLSSNSTGRPQKGEVVTGSVSKIFSTGVVVSFKQGHQGFLPASEVLSSTEMVDTTSHFRVGQQIPVRVLRTMKNRITLTMKNQVKPDENREAVLSSPEERATSPFEIAFRRIEVIAKFLEERERLQSISSGKMDENPTIFSATEINES